MNAQPLYMWNLFECSAQALQFCVIQYQRVASAEDDFIDLIVRAQVFERPLPLIFAWI